jgi:carbon-monoxide dehydrogenase large subunit
VSHLGVRHIDMPCTSERVWAAINAAASGNADPWRDPPPVFSTLPKGLEGDADAAADADGI